VFLLKYIDLVMKIAIYIYVDGSISPAWYQRLGYIRALMFLVV